MHTSDRPDADAKSGRLQETVVLLLHEAREGFEERRSEKRNPFFSPVQIARAEDGLRHFSCFSRDISPGGISLLHSMPIEPGEVVLTIPSKLCGKVRIRSEVVWCQPCGEGWFISGAKFLEMLTPV